MPVTSVPMKLPWTTPLRLRTPIPPLPEIRLPAPASGPPTMTLPAVRLGLIARTPPLPFPRAFVPVTSVPIRLPCTKVSILAGNEPLA